MVQILFQCDRCTGEVWGRWYLKDAANILSLNPVEYMACWCYPAIIQSQTAAMPSPASEFRYYVVWCYTTAGEKNYIAVVFLEMQIFI